MNGMLRFQRTVSVKSNPDFYTRLFRRRVVGRTSPCRGKSVCGSAAPRFEWKETIPGWLRAITPCWIEPGLGLRPTPPPDGQRDHFRRAHEANRHVGCAKAGGDNEMTVSLDDMTVDKIEVVLAAYEIRGEYG